MIGMEPDQFLDRYPSELSGGQQQRIGVARAFANNPDVILMDEPFSALDPITRNQLQDELYMLQQDLKKTIVFVTHDMSEALKLGDKICIMKDGQIMQYDTPERILKEPQRGFVDEFIGKDRIWENPEFIKAKDIMIKEPVKTFKERTISQGIEIMKEHKIDSLLITDNKQKLIGLVTAKAMRKTDDKSKKISEIMETEFRKVNEDDSLLDIIREKTESNKRFFPVVKDDNILAGLITRSSLLEVLSSQYVEGVDDDE